MYLLNGKYKILRWLIFCVMIPWVKGRKYNNLLQFNTSWFASLETWYYFRLYFSCSCSGYELTLIKRSHTLNCYWLLQKFLMKTKTYKLVVGNCGSSIYCQQIQKKPSPFCYFMSCPINKVSFWQFQVEKNVFAAGNGGRGGGGRWIWHPPALPFPTVQYIMNMMKKH